MGFSRFFFLFLLIITSYLFIDFPAAKMILHGFSVLILFSFFYTRIIKKGLKVERVSKDYRTFSGINEEILLLVKNNSFLPIHALQIEDYADLSISTSQGCSSLIFVPPDKEERFDYNVMGRKRGRFKIGPTRIKFNDFLGLFSFHYEENTERELIVFPNICRISNISYKSIQPLGAIKNRVPIFEDPSTITGLREYQEGDEIKRINWKISAKHSKFMITTLQHSISSSSLILVNLFDGEFDFRLKDYYTEQAIEICASLLSELFFMKQRMGVGINCRKNRKDMVFLSQIERGENHYINLLTELALIESTPQIPFRGVFEELRTIQWGVSLFIITARLDEVSLDKLIGLQRTGHTVTIINYGPEIRKDLSLWNIGFQSFYADISDNVISIIRL